MKIAVAGRRPHGRMLVEAIQQPTIWSWAAPWTAPSPPTSAADAAAFLGRPSGVAIASEFSAGLAGVDLLIDFTRPKPRWRIWRIAPNTASDGHRHHRLDQAARTPSPRRRKRRHRIRTQYDVGVNVTMKLLELAQGFFARLRH